MKKFKAFRAKYGVDVRCDDDEQQETLHLYSLDELQTPDDPDDVISLTDIFPNDPQRRLRILNLSYINAIYDDLKRVSRYDTQKERDYMAVQVDMVNWLNLLVCSKLVRERKKRRKKKKKRRRMSMQEETDEADEADEADEQMNSLREQFLALVNKVPPHVELLDKLWDFDPNNPVEGNDEEFVAKYKFAPFKQINQQLPLITFDAYDRPQFFLDLRINLNPTRAEQAMLKFIHEHMKCANVLPRSLSDERGGTYCPPTFNACVAIAKKNTPLPKTPKKPDRVCSAMRRLIVKPRPFLIK